MNNNRSDMFSDLEFALYYQLDITPEADISSAYKGFKSATSIKKPHASEKGVIFALGFIAALLFFGGWKLYRCVNPNPIRAKTSSLLNIRRIAPIRASTFKTEKSIVEIPVKRFEHSASLYRIETLSIQNVISHGKF